MRALSQIQFRQLLVGFFAVAALVLSGCGDEDLCSGVSCEFGTCDSANGQCVNPGECRFDNDCVPGYDCGADYTCEPVAECTADDDCNAGVCDGGACVNPSSCESNDDCVARTFCGPGGSCERDPCSDIDCQRGVCQRGTDQCVSADSCTPQTEQLDCVAGEKCAQGSCQPADSFCDEITCERGECSFEAGGCVSADDCQGDDTLCEEGAYCNDQNQCQPDLCAQNDVDCGDNGVCVPSAGACQNATSCASNSDCTSDHLCVDGTCRLAAVACGDAGGEGGCPGQQSCEFDEDTLSASCSEPAECTTSFDCTGDRQCGGLECIDPVSCQDDYFEPNNAADVATDFLGLADSGTLSGSICTGDSDFYAVTTTDITDASARGTLLVEVDVPARDHGLGGLEVILTGPDGSTRDASTGAMGADGNVRIEQAIGLTDHGEYTVEISAADDLTDAGVRYDLSVNLLPEETIKACEEAIDLRVNQRVSGSTEASGSGYLGSSCTSEPNPSGDAVYKIELDAPQEVTFTLTPLLSSSNLSMSLRGRCTQGASERACADETAAGETETMTALLEAGTHYLVVQSPDSTGGDFELLVDTIYTACAASDAYCEDQQVARVCTPDGGRFLSINCDAGCHPASGRCFPPVGDTCFDAPIIDAPTQEQFDLVQANDDYRLGDTQCFDGAVEASSGPEQTFQIEVPAQKGFTADVLFDSEVEGSVYLAENCSDMTGTCLAGVTGSTAQAFEESLTYSNRTDDPVTLFIVVDTYEGQPLATASLAVDYFDVVCSPDALQCDGSGNVEKCDAYGREFNEEEDCKSWGCDTGVCQIPNTCGQAMDVTPQLTQSGSFSITAELDDFSDEFNGAYCGLSTSRVDGPDSVFQVDMQAGEVLEATATFTGYVWPAVAIVSDCTDVIGTCQQGQTATSSSATTSYQATAAETVYVIVDNDNYSTSGNSATIDLSLSAGCDQATYTNSCLDADTLEYCNSNGIASTYTCTGGCSAGECGSPTGDVCVDAIDATAGGTFSGDFSTLGADITVSSTACSGMGYTQDGREAVYSVDLLAGQTVDASMTSSTSTDLAIFIVSDCADAENSCLIGDDSGNPEAASYTAASDMTVYVVAAAYSATSGLYDLDVTVTGP